jgi:hypothetical protein
LWAARVEVEGSRVTGLDSFGILYLLDGMSGGMGSGAKVLGLITANGLSLVFDLVKICLGPKSFGHEVGD